MVREPRYWQDYDFHSSSYVLHGELRLNPILKNTQAIVAIDRIEQALSLRAKSSSTSPARDEVGPEMITDNYVSLERINELRAINSNEFDLTRLIGICEELNKCEASSCSVATAALVRVILDHVPPIFGQKSFLYVASHHGGRSLKKSFQNLQKSSRNIADRHLHTPIRKKESLPTPTQVDFSNDLDVLLEEIVRLLK